MLNQKIYVEGYLVYSINSNIQCSGFVSNKLFRHRINKYKWTSVIFIDYKYYNYNKFITDFIIYHELGHLWIHKNASYFNSNRDMRIEAFCDIYAIYHLNFSKNDIRKLIEFKIETSRLDKVLREHKGISTEMRFRIKMLTDYMNEEFTFKDISDSIIKIYTRENNGIRRHTSYKIKHFNEIKNRVPNLYLDLYNKKKAENNIKKDLRTVSKHFPIKYKKQLREKNII